MACPTCDHTMQGLGDRWFWCPRCGTTLNGHDREHTVTVPFVVRDVKAWLASAAVTPEHARRRLAGHFPQHREGGK